MVLCSRDAGCMTEHQHVASKPWPSTDCTDLSAPTLSQLLLWRTDIEGIQLTKASPRKL